MSDKTGIQWTEATWNPVTGCTKVSQGCKNCYAKHQAWPRLRASPGTVYFGREFEDVKYHRERLEQPLRWKRPRRIFVNSMSDLFHEAVTGRQLDEIFAVMLMSPQHQFQILTKRAERMLQYVGELDLLRPIRSAARIAPKREINSMEWPPKNVWLGVSVEDQVTADERIPLLLRTPAAVRWISAEPLLGPIDLRSHLEGHCTLHDFPGGFCIQRDHQEVQRLAWVVVGGESGTDARPMHPDWARSLRDQCIGAGVPFFFKQWGEYLPVYDRDKEDPDMRRCAAIEENIPNGRWLNLAGGHGFSAGKRVHYVERVGKKWAGRELDDREWNEYPA